MFVYLLRANQEGWMGEMQFLNVTGHSTLVWDPVDESSIGIAEAEFDKLLHEGFVAFQREHKDRAARRVETFDPSADEILWLRPLRGG
jgi:hypothetical protein